MKNLHIMHTQYNLILSAGVTTRSQNDENVLILWAEFKVTEEILQALKKIYSRVVVVCDHYMDMKKFKKIHFIRACVKKVKDIKNEKFDRLYMTQEREFDRIVCRSLKKKNPELKCYDIEEDAYFSVKEEYNSPDYEYKVTLKVKLRKYIYALFIGYPYNYREGGYCYGMSSEYDGANLLFPEHARKALHGKELIEITKDELLSGIGMIYSERKTTYPEAERYVLIFFDLISRYKNREVVCRALKTVIEQCEKKNITVLAKYHPRETEKFTDFKNVYEIEQLIPSEKVLADFFGKDVTVIHNTSTSGLVASKLGYKVISICKLDLPDNKIMHQIIESLGIQCIDNINDVIL